MEFDEEGMNVFKQAVDDFIAAGESASFELAGRVLAAARMAVDAVEEDLVFFVKHFSLKKASEFPVFSEGFSLL